MNQLTTQTIKSTGTAIARIRQRYLQKNERGISAAYNEPVVLRQGAFMNRVGDKNMKITPHSDVRPFFNLLKRRFALIFLHESFCLGEGGFLPNGRKPPSPIVISMG